MIVLLLAGCYESYQNAVDAEAHGDADADADTDDCSGAWLDPTTGYLWEDPPWERARHWGDAVAYCNGLSLCSHPAGDWHLPTISELRTLIRGCPATETGGSCGVTDACLGDGCRDDSCDGCPMWYGPAIDGAYWPPELRGAAEWYWSSSYAGGASFFWAVTFRSGYVINPAEVSSILARCVRPGP